MRSVGIRALALMIAGLLLCGCGSAFQSPAALVNGAKITEGDLEHQLTLLLSNPQFGAQIRGPGGAERKKDLTRRLLAFLIRERIVAGYAARHGISVSGSEIDQALAQAVAQSGGKARFDQLLRSRHLSLPDVRDNVRSSLLEQKVRAAVVGPTSSDQATAQRQDQAFTAWLARLLKSSDISVNPRFGRFDPARDVICPIDSTADGASCPAA
jgi:hypothetical protein